MRPSEIRPGIRRLFRLAVRRADHTRDDADEEIRLHLRLRAEQLVREGLSPDEQPTAGALFRCRPGVQGVPALTYAG